MVLTPVEAIASAFNRALARYFHNDVNVKQERSKSGQKREQRIIVQPLPLCLDPPATGSYNRELAQSLIDEDLLYDRTTETIARKTARKLYYSSRVPAIGEAGPSDWHGRSASSLSPSPSPAPTRLDTLSPPSPTKSSPKSNTAMSFSRDTRDWLRMFHAPRGSSDESGDNHELPAEEEDQAQDQERRRRPSFDTSLSGTTLVYQSSSANSLHSIPDDVVIASPTAELNRLLHQSITQQPAQDQIDATLRNAPRSLQNDPLRGVVVSDFAARHQVPTPILPPVRAASPIYAEVVQPSSPLSQEPILRTQMQEASARPSTRLSSQSSTSRSRNRRSPLPASGLRNEVIRSGLRNEVIPPSSTLQGTENATHSSGDSGVSSTIISYPSTSPRSREHSPHRPSALPNEAFVSPSAPQRRQPPSHLPATTSSSSHISYPSVSTTSSLRNNRDRQISWVLEQRERHHEEQRRQAQLQQHHSRQVATSAEFCFPVAASSNPLSLRQWNTQALAAFRAHTRERRARVAANALLSDLHWPTNSQSPQPIASQSVPAMVGPAQQLQAPRQQHIPRIRLQAPQRASPVPQQQRMPRLSSKAPQRASSALPLSPKAPACRSQALHELTRTDQQPSPVSQRAYLAPHPCFRAPSQPPQAAREVMRGTQQPSQVRRSEPAGTPYQPASRQQQGSPRPELEQQQQQHARQFAVPKRYRRFRSLLSSLLPKFPRPRSSLPSTAGERSLDTKTSVSHLSPTDVGDATRSSAGSSLHALAAGVEKYVRHDSARDSVADHAERKDEAVVECVRMNMVGM